MLHSHEPNSQPQPLWAVSVLMNLTVSSDMTLHTILFLKNGHLVKCRAVSFLRTPNWLLWPVFYPKAAVSILSLPFCLIFHLLPPHFNALLILLSFFPLRPEQNTALSPIPHHYICTHPVGDSILSTSNNCAVCG